jgi:hypothetical protein
MTATVVPFTPGTQDECKKGFKKSEAILHYVHIAHNVFGIIIWAVIVLLLVDYYHHVLPHVSHGVILWFEFTCYTLFLAIPYLITKYRNYKNKSLPARCQLQNTEHVKAH